MVTLRVVLLMTITCLCILSLESVVFSCTWPNLVLFLIMFLEVMGDSGCICSVAQVCSGRGHLGLCESNQLRSHNRTVYRCLFLEKCSIINLCVNVF